MSKVAVAPGTTTVRLPSGRVIAAGGVVESDVTLELPGLANAASWPLTTGGTTGGTTLTQSQVRKPVLPLRPPTFRGISVPRVDGVYLVYEQGDGFTVAHGWCWCVSGLEVGGVAHHQPVQVEIVFRRWSNTDRGLTLHETKHVFGHARMFIAPLEIFPGDEVVVFPYLDDDLSPVIALHGFFYQTPLPEETPF